MIALGIFAALIICRQGGLLTGPGFAGGEKRLGWAMLCIGVGCGVLAGRA